MSRRSPRPPRPNLRRHTARLVHAEPPPIHRRSSADPATSPDARIERSDRILRCIRPTTYISRRHQASLRAPQAHHHSNFPERTGPLITASLSQPRSLSMARRAPRPHEDHEVEQHSAHTNTLPSDGIYRVSVMTTCSEHPHRASAMVEASTRSLVNLNDYVSVVSTFLSIFRDNSRVHHPS